MKPAPPSGLIDRIYSNVELALWAMVIAGLAVFAVVVVPGIPQAQRAADLAQERQMQQQYARYCERWGLVPGTRAHNECMADLRHFRRAVERQAEADNDF